MMPMRVEQYVTKHSPLETLPPVRSVLGADELCRPGRQLGPDLETEADGAALPGLLSILSSSPLCSHSHPGQHQVGPAQLSPRSEVVILGGF